MNRGLCKLQAERLKQSFVAVCRAVHSKKLPDSTEKNDPKPPDSTVDDTSKPLKFSTSRGSHRTWTVEKSFGSEYQQPWWKVLPICLTMVAVLLWAAFRKESEIDKVLYRSIPELLEEINKAKEEQEKSK